MGLGENFKCLLRLFQHSVLYLYYLLAKKEDGDSQVVFKSIRAQEFFKS